MITGSCFLASGAVPITADKMYPWWFGSFSPIGQSNHVCGWTGSIQAQINEAEKIQNTIDNPPRLCQNGVAAINYNTKIMTQNMKFSTAVLFAIRNVAAANASFSIHDITRKLRDLVNGNEIAFTDRTAEDVNGVTTFKVEHNDVREIFDDIFNTQVIEFTRKFNGTYYEYSTVLASTTSSQKPVATTVPTAIIATATVAATAPVIQNTPSGVDSAKLKDYLSKRSGSVTMKQIQSRFDTVRGVSCNDYAHACKTLGYTVQRPNNFPSSWYIQL